MDIQSTLNSINLLREELIEAFSDSVTREEGRDKTLNKPSKKHTTFMHPMEYYNERVLLSIPSLDAFQIELEFVETKEQLDIWKYFRYHTSSIKTHQNIGRNLKFMVRDKDTKKYIGIVTIGSDIYGCSDRDAAIGWTKEQHTKHLSLLVNIWGCVALQPIGFNYNIGKLLASLCFTREVLDKFKEKYGETPACITTFGAFGISAQYERLPYLKRVGKTKGYNCNGITEELYMKACRIYCDVFETTKICARGGRLDNLKTILRWLNIPTSLIKENGTKRSIYVGFTSPNAREFLRSGDGTYTLPNDTTIPTVTSIVEWWKQRWAKQRYSHLLDTNRIQTTSRVKWTWEPNEKKQYTYKHKHLYNTLPIHEYKLSDSEVNFYHEMKLEPSYIAGLLDGDGTVSFMKHVYSSYINICQCDPRPLIALQGMFGGNIRILTSERSQHERLQYCYCVHTYNEPLLKIMKDYSILKSKRSNYCYEHLFGNSHELDIDLSKEAYDTIVGTIQQLQGDYTPCQETYYESRMTLGYIAGLFDAEGMIRTNHFDTYISSDITITQKSNIKILEAIRNHLGYGKCKQYCFREYGGDNKISFIKAILPYLIVKKEQSECLLKTLETPICRIGECYKDVKDIKIYKYREFHISREQLSRINAIGKSKLLESKKPFRLKPFIEKIKQTRSTKGIPMVMNHRAAIALHTTLKRKKIEDSLIESVREQLKTKTQARVCRDMNLKRHIVYNIATGLTMKTDEITIDSKRKQVENKHFRKEHLTKEAIIEQTAIRKRKLSLNTMIQILQWIQEPNATPTSVYDRMLLDITSKNIKKNFSIDSIKAVINGKTQPYDSEYPLLGTITKETYKGWLDKISTLDFVAARKIQMGRKVRSVSPETIVKAFLLWIKEPTLTQAGLAEHFGIAPRTLGRFLQHPELYYQEDFPVTIDGVIYTYDDFVCLTKTKRG